MYIEKRLVSIIVPVYNAEQYLCKCIESILAQTYTDWELLLIDDGSKDNSRSICESYSNKDNRIIVLRKENSGVSDTRNFGIDHSRGDCICFIDADDWIRPKFIEHLMHFSEYDYVIAGYETWPDNSKCILKERTYKRDEMPIMFDEFLQTRPTSCATLFKTGIIKERHIQFTSKLRSREDHLFNVQYLRWCNSACTINYQEYIVRSRRIPIAIKFKMHSKDIEMVINSLIDGYKCIEDEFGYKVKDLRPTLNIMSQYYLEDFVRFQNDDDYYGVYRSFFHSASKEEMYTDKDLNSANLILDGIIAYKQVDNTEKMQELISLFAAIFKSVNSDTVIFRNNTYRNIAVAIMSGQPQYIESETKKECRKREMDFFIGKNLRPIFYWVKKMIKTS